MLRLDLERCPYVVADSSRSLALSTQTSRWGFFEAAFQRVRFDPRQLAARNTGPAINAIMLVVFMVEPLRRRGQSFLVSGFAIAPVRAHDCERRMGHTHIPGIVFAMPCGSSTATFTSALSRLECERCAARCRTRSCCGTRRQAESRPAWRSGVRCSDRPRASVRPRRRHSTSSGGIDATKTRRASAVSMIWLSRSPSAGRTAALRVR